MERYTYLLILAGILIASGWLQFLPGVHVFDRPRRLGLALLPGVLFIGWDLLATGSGWWHFNPDRVIGASLFGLPIEEWLFFVVVPTACVLGFEAVRTTLARWRAP